MGDIFITDILNFKYGELDLLSPDIYYQSLKEIFIFDIYRSNLLRRNDLVVDLGASIGEFSILASQKVGKKGKVIAIEPNIQDYEMLRENIKRNNCENIIPVNLGVGTRSRESEMTLYGRRFRFREDTLTNIIDGLQIGDDINFLKMDIEGSEIDVVSNSIELIKKANVISMELHGKGTKEKIDKMLYPHGFAFEPITMSYIYRKSIKNLFLHPFLSSKMYLHTVKNNPKILLKAITGLDITKDFLVNGSYVRYA